MESEKLDSILSDYEKAVNRLGKTPTYRQIEVVKKIRKKIENDYSFNDISAKSRKNKIDRTYEKIKNEEESKGYLVADKQMKIDSLFLLTYLQDYIKSLSNEEKEEASHYYSQAVLGTLNDELAFAKLLATEGLETGLYRSFVSVDRVFKKIINEAIDNVNEGIFLEQYKKEFDRFKELKDGFDSAEGYEGKLKFINDFQVKKMN